MQKNIFGIIIFFTVIVSQILLIPAYDALEIRTMFLCVVGISAMIIMAACNKIRWQHLFISTPLIWVIIRGASYNVEGYTIYKVCEYIAMFGIMFLVGASNIKLVISSLISFVFIQSAFTWLPMEKVYGIPQIWERKFIDTYEWGTVRHRIRFATEVFTSIIGAIEIFGWNKICKVISVIVIGFSLFVIIKADSHTILAGVIILSSIYVYMKNKKIAAVLFFAGVLTVIFTQPQGFIIDDGRLSMWKMALKESTESVKFLLIGHGIGSWELFRGVMPIDTGHPHCDALLLLFEQGLIGVMLWTITVLILILYAGKNIVYKVGLILVTLSFMTNSMFAYSDMWLVWSLIAGLCLSETKDYEWQYLDHL